MHLKSLLFFLLTLILVAGCANPPIVKMSEDTYVIFREEHAGIFGSGAGLRAEVIQDAQEFAESKGKVAVPTSSKFTPMGTGPAQWASFEYQFKMVDKDKAGSFNLPKETNSVISLSNEVTVNQIPDDLLDKAPDIYQDLLKLDDLKEKKIITEDEFQEMKYKLLQNYKAEQN